jgi:hypothetical protein
MSVDAKFEAVFGQIELVRGTGNRRRAQLCIMSLAAFLAGENHSDSPATASPLVRRFALTINDEMPAQQRQKLKLFAPLIVGTRDSRDSDRANVLITAMRTELLPRIEAEFGHAPDAVRLSDLTRNARTWPDIYQRVITLVSSTDQVLNEAECEEIVFAIARLISCCGQVAPLPEQRAWYWTQAINLLDRMCTIGIDDGRPAISAEHLDAIADFLDHRRHWNAQRRRVAAAWERACTFIPVLVR